MRIPKQDALNWYRFFAELPEDEPLSPRQEELKYAVLRQLEDAAAARRQPLLDKLRAPKTLGGRTMYVGPDEKFPAGCRSCLHGTGLSAVRRTNRCDANCPFCYDYGQLDRQPPIGDGLWEIGGSRCYAEDLPLLLSASRKPTGVAYVYLEPMLEIEQYYPVIRAFHDAGVHQHLYTNGIRCTEEILRDREIYSMRIVTTPERIVLQEARRSFTWINEYDFGVDAVYVNKIYPKEAMQGYFGGWEAMQRESLQLAAESFPGRKQFRLLLQETEIRGAAALEKAGDQLYGEEDPAQIFCREEAFRMEYDLKTGIRSLIISLPYAEAEEIRTEKEGDDLILFVRNEVRRLRLPDILCRRDLDGQSFENGELTIRFGYAYQRRHDP